MTDKNLDIITICPYGLKLKEFKVKLQEATDANYKRGNGEHYITWINGVYNNSGGRIGWVIAIDHEDDDSMYHLLNNKGVDRIFKTIDSAVSAFSSLGIVGGSKISWCE